METYFDNICNEIKLKLKKAENRVLICVAWLDIDIYFNIFMDLLSRNVSVTLILTYDKRLENHNDMIYQLREKGALIEIISMHRYLNKMHNKFCIIDRKTIISGSYNWTNNANNNFETINIFEPSLSIIKEYEYEATRIVKFNRFGLDKIFKFEKCPFCNKNMINALIIVGYECKLVKMCTYDSAHFITPNLCFDNYIVSHLESIYSKYDSQLDNHIYYPEFDFEKYKKEIQELEKFEINMLLDEYSYNNTLGFIIHAVGRVTISNSFSYDYEKSIQFFWFNKFIKHLIEKDYYDTFDLW